MNWNKKINYLLYKVFEKELNEGRKLSEIALLVEPFQQKYSLETDIMQIWNYVDDFVANTIGNKAETSIGEFRNKFTEQVISHYANEVNAASKSTSEILFIRYFITLFKEWKIPYINNYLKKITNNNINIEYWLEFARLINHRRFVEIYPYLSELISNNKIDDSLKANLYAIAAQIQLYFIGNKLETSYLLNKGAELNPNIPNLKETQGGYYIENFEFEKANVIFEKMLLVNAEKALGYICLGNCIKKGYSKNTDDQFNDAKFQYSKAKATAPGNLSIYVNENSLYCISEEIYKKNKKAIEENYEIQLKIEPQCNYDFTLDYGYNCQAAFDLEKAKKWFEDALKIDKNRIEAYVALGHWNLLQVKTGSDKFISETENAFRQSIDLGKTCFDGYWGLYLLYQKQDKYDEAIKTLASSYHLFPLFKELCHREISNLYEKKGAPYLKEAAKYLLNAIEIVKIGEEKYKNEPSFFENLGLDYEKLATIESDITLKDNYIENAEMVFLKAIKLNTESGNYLNRIGIFYYNQKLYDKSIDYYKLAIEKEPENTTFKNNLKLSEDAQIPEILLKKLSSEPNNHEILSKLGIINLEKENYDEAVKYFKKAISLNNEELVLKTNLAIALNSIGIELGKQLKYENAQKYYKEAIKYDSNNWIYQANIGDCLINLNKKNEAIKAYLKARDLDINEYTNWNALGILYLDTKQNVKATKCFEKAIELNNEVPVLKTNLAIAFNSIGMEFFNKSEYKNALDYFLKASSQDEVNWLYHDNIGTANKLLGDFEHAIVAYKKALDLNENEYFTSNSLAILYIDHNQQYDLAVECLEKAISLNNTGNLKTEFPSSIYRNLSIAYNGLGVKYYANYEDEKAVENYKKAIELYKEDIVYYKNLVLALHSLDKNDQAIEIINNTLSVINKDELRNYFDTLMVR